MKAAHRGHGTVALLVLLVPITLSMLMLVWVVLRLSEDRRSQQAADAAVMAGAQVVATRANGIAALNEAAAESMAYAALAQAVCPAWRFGNELEEQPPDLSRALAAAGQVCGEEESGPAISDRYLAAACRVLSQAMELYEDLDSDAAESARMAAEALGAEQVGLAPEESLLRAEIKGADALCERAGDHLSSLLSATDLAAASSSTEGRQVYAVLRSSAWSALSSACAGGGCLGREGVADFSECEETRILAWVETPIVLPGFVGLDAPSGSLAGVSVAGGIAQNKRGAGIFSRAWYARISPVQRSNAAVPAGSRGSCPELHWELLEH